MFEPKIEIKMNGTEYLEYKRYKDNKKRTHAIPRRYYPNIIWFAVSFIAFLFLILLIQSVFPSEPNPTYAEKLVSYSSISQLSWNQIAKLNAAMYGGWIMLAMGAAWILHGFGFILVRK